ncbi:MULTISPECIES: DUF134 domain-containing protein [Desulfococcus]|jgi:predicted DNA-binding protein (UPF0251 family)|uniref:UPF0251 protein dsmv_3770 n=1 Tax=Desulfococcus multivorans DSM 2059 TaxID=1121405 RepID=S7VDR5_DESML|nr:DUF134 domain-containing protein [Desulfococcus multivorans]AOY58870.1 conserved uncharacterized protein, DUF134 [Desulfococcus multivorans]AQV01154.1 hypothetical protein B2D07_10475 [Desulfococcus multivorans]EPR44844.1 UPF0251 protein [Desulfococcus multivorans DSM 2059]MDX9819765.1 DUF134 domain-containing protein [Desulfococcus multivorans]SJZ52175.1 Protein of unknown function DUF134 [Desulfococcus multivorans DSM 2059]
MVRPKKNRLVAFNPEISYFKPRGIPMVDLEEVSLTVDERESIRLSDLLGLSYEEAGQRMGVSRATFGRIIQRARKVIADALINGKAINVDGGNYTIVEDNRIFVCDKCNYKWDEPLGTGKPESCPACNSRYFHRVSE